MSGDDTLGPDTGGTGAYGGTDAERETEMAHEGFDRSMQAEQVTVGEGDDARPVGVTLERGADADDEEWAAAAYVARQVLARVDGRPEDAPGVEPVETTDPDAVEEGEEVFRLRGTGFGGPSVAVAPEEYGRARDAIRAEAPFDVAEEALEAERGDGEARIVADAGSLLPHVDAATVDGMGDVGTVRTAVSAVDEAVREGDAGKVQKATETLLRTAFAEEEDEEVAAVSVTDQQEHMTESDVPDRGNEGEDKEPIDSLDLRDAGAESGGQSL